MKVFASRKFDRFAKKCGLKDEAMCEAAIRAERGLVDADLGGGVIKQRAAREGEGRSSGFRTLILFRRGERSVFVHGFAKNDRANITLQERRALQALAGEVLAWTADEEEAAVASGALRRVSCDEEQA